MPLPHRWLLATSCLAFAALGLTGRPPADVEPGDLRPGLPAVYRSLTDPTAVLHRTDAKPAFTLGHSSPHPRLPPGPFEAVWTGFLAVREPGPLTFTAFVGGELTVIVDGATVLHSRGASDVTAVGPGEPLRRPPGLYPIMIRYRSAAAMPARLQIHWEGPTFAREPMPAWRLFYLPAALPAEARREAQAFQGRELAGRLGCARCHQGHFPAADDPPPGPSLAEVGKRVGRAWLLHWLEDPAKVRPGAHMPALFAADRHGYAERWLIAEHLAGERLTDARTGDHRAGRLAFVGLGCAACHFVPDLPRSEQPALGRTPLTGLGDRFAAADLAAFLTNPHGRYPDGRMPRFPVTPESARDIAAYLLLWSKPTPEEPAEPPAAEALEAVARRLGVRGRAAAAQALLREKGCASCHPGLGATLPQDVAISDPAGGCLTGQKGPRYSLDGPTREALAAYLAVARLDRYPSPYDARQRLLRRAGCFQCHQHDTDRPPPVEEAGSTLGGGFHQLLPYQRTPRLSFAHQKYTAAHLLRTVREGAAGLRSARYTYRMPAFGADAAALVQALAEGDGDLPGAAEPPDPPAADPTAAPLHGPILAGFQGYACVSCHVWKGQLIADTDPGALGPDLTHTAGRIRRDWFTRFLDDPARMHPNTPMPGIFRRGQKALLDQVLDGDTARQKEALWHYFALGQNAPSPKPLPPIPIEAPALGEDALVAQIPIHLPGGAVVESVCVLTDRHDLLIYDLAAMAPFGFTAGGQILRTTQGRLRKFHAGAPGLNLAASAPLQLVSAGATTAPTALALHGYDRLPDGVRLRWQAQFPAGAVAITETLRIVRDGPQGRLVRELKADGIPVGARLEFPGLAATLTPDTPTATADLPLPPAQAAPPWKGKPLADPGQPEGALERPGYRAVALPRPKTVSGEDRIMPAAVAVHPRDGRVFVASLKTGELFALHDAADPRQAKWQNYGRGLFQDALSLLADDDALYVLHRRNLTRTPDGIHFERVASLPHGVADTYDYGYGLARDRGGAFVLSFAPYANTQLPGSGGGVRLVPGKPPEEVAYGMRNPLGWCAGPEGEIFFTDNQGEWVATNKLCHLEPGKFYGFPNAAQKQHANKPPGRAAVWVPYGWARSINGVAYDHTGGQFGPFAGQFFLAELMFGGALIRAQVEKVNGVYQGACFPFWGQGLMGPVSLAFSPRGQLYVGGITEPGWMAQPDRGALYRIDYTGPPPFEILAIHVRPNGFRLAFTGPVDPATARDPMAYQLEHYRYEYTGAYGSPELDRTRVPVERAAVAADGRGVELTIPALVKDRVYLIGAPGVRSAAGAALVHPTGAYTLNEVPGP